MGPSDYAKLIRQQNGGATFELPDGEQITITPMMGVIPTGAKIQTGTPVVYPSDCAGPVGSYRVSSSFDQ